MSSVHVKSTLRIIVTSFAAGAGAMVLACLVAPVALLGGLSIRDAMAATVDAKGPVIEPLDVAAVQAQLAEADRSMVAARLATEGAMHRLDRLSGR